MSESGYDYRNHFSIFKNKSLIYFDNASTTYKPDCVIDTITNYYQNLSTNVFRGSYSSVEQVSYLFELCREKVAKFIGAGKESIVFTYGCTDSINSLISLLDLKKSSDFTLVSDLAHHSLYLPLNVNSNVLKLKLDSLGKIDLDYLEQMLAENKNIKLVAVSYVSNVTGNVQPVKEISNLAKKYGVYTLIDAAQAIAHFPVDAKKIDCDFLTFSAHKMMGPTGVGVLYIKREHLKYGNLKFFRYGGGMVNKIKDGFDVVYKDAPYCFEAGTPNIAGILGFSSTIDFFNKIGFDKIELKLKELERVFYQKLIKQDFLKLIHSRNSDHSAIFTFLPQNSIFTTKQFATNLSDAHNFAVGFGQQCCQTFYNSIEVTEGIRVSLYIYNTISEIEDFFEVINSLCDFCN